MKKTMLRLALTVLALVLVCSLASCKDDEPGSLIGSDTTTPAPEVTTPTPETTVHVHEYASTVINPTCYSPGYTLSVCLCGDQQITEPTEQLAHTYGEWKVTTAATCSAEGSQTRTCTAEKCNASETQSIAKLAHDYAHTVTAPTKTTQGYTVHTCRNCNDSYTDSYTNATGSLGLSYSQNADGTLTITGMGLCTDTDVIIYAATAEGKSVTAIAEGAFAGNTTIKTISLPESIVSIGEGAFAGCTALTQINVNSANANYASLEGVLYNKALTILVAFPAGRANTSYTIANAIVDIRPSAFAGCVNLEEFKLESTSNKIFAVYNGVLYRLDANGKATTLIAYPAGKIETDGAIQLGALTGVVTNIGDYAFYGAVKLKTMNIAGLISIGAHAFENCPELKSITLADSVRKIGEYSFAGCSALTYVSIGSGLRNITANSFNGCTALGGIELPDTVDEIQEYAFSNCISLRYILIGSGVEEIRERAFSGCNNLIQVLYKGNATDWFYIDMHSSNNTTLTITATLFFYSDALSNPSTGTVKYWHYVTDSVTGNKIPSVVW